MSAYTQQSMEVLDEDQTLQSVLEIIANSTGQDQPFFVFNVDDLLQKHARWMDKLARVKPYYAVQCNDSENVLQTLNTLGVGFSCASEAEVKRILSLGVLPDRIVFNQPFKMLSHLRFVARKNVRKITFDCDTELYKIKEHFPAASLILRIRSSDESAGKKFGCDPNKEAMKLLKLAYNLSLNVIGVSFHIGSDCRCNSIYYETIKTCKKLFSAAKSYGFKLNFMDIGGGFSGCSAESFDIMSQYVNRALEKFFPDSSGVEVIAEPGRYFVESAFTLATNIHSKKSTRKYDDNYYMYHINDGVYGSFSMMLTNRMTVQPKVFGKTDQATYKCTVWGPTCDGVDKILEDAFLPELEVGDWIFFEDIGAYSMVMSTSFNCFPTAKVYPYISRDNWLTLQQMEKCI